MHHRRGSIGRHRACVGVAILVAFTPGTAWPCSLVDVARTDVGEGMGPFPSRPELRFWMPNRTTLRLELTDASRRQIPTVVMTNEVPRDRLYGERRPTQPCDPFGRYNRVPTGFGHARLGRSHAGGRPAKSRHRIRGATPKQTPLWFPLASRELVVQSLLVHCGSAPINAIG